LKKLCFNKYKKNQNKNLFLVRKSRFEEEKCQIGEQQISNRLLLGWPNWTVAQKSILNRLIILYNIYYKNKHVVESLVMHVTGHRHREAASHDEVSVAMIQDGSEVDVKELVDHGRVQVVDGEGGTQKVEITSCSMHTYF
jgi:hypothetical protein